MTKIYVPAESDYALALREPNLLVPGRAPIGPIKVSRYWANKGLLCAWVFGGRYGGGVDLHRGRNIDVGPGVSIGQDYIMTAGTSAGVVDIEVGTNAVDPITVVVDSERTSGTVQWSLLETNLSWSGIYGEANGEIKTTSANSFDGVINAAAGGSPGKAIAAVFSDGTLRGSYRGGPIATDASATSPASLDRAFATLGGNRRILVENPSVTRFRVFAVFGQALSDSDLRVLSSSAYALFEPANDAPFLFSVGGGALTPPVLGEVTGVSLTPTTARITIPVTFS